VKATRVALLVISCALAYEGTAATWYVDGTAAGGGDGSSWDKAFTTIQSARDVSNDGDTIIVAPGLYSDPTGTISFGKGVTLRSRDPNDPGIVSTTILEGTGIRSVNGQRSFAVHGFTMRGGRVSLAGRSVTITQNVIIGSPSRSNRGISVHTREGLVAGNVIVGHNAGGISCRYSSLSITNNLILGNSTGGCGGAILCEESSVLITNNTIVGNHAKGAGGGIFSDDESDVSIRNCILWANGDDLYNCQATYSCVEDGDPGEGNFNYYPHFVSPAGGDYHLASWSPCTDTGDPVWEFSNEPEPNGGRINMGAYGNTSEAACRSPDVGEDGLPDEWEMLHFGHLDHDGQGDVDGDGILNVTEYLFGWDPMHPATTLVENITRGHLYQEIQPAIFEADGGDEIVVFPGTYNENINFMGKAISVCSADPLDPPTVASTVIEGDTGQIASFTTGESRCAMLSGLKLTHPIGISGPAILCTESSPTISHNIITYNTIGARGVTTWSPEQPEKGAAVQICGGAPLLEGNTIEYNHSTYGAAVYCEAAEPVIRSNLLTHNSGLTGALQLKGCLSAVIEANQITHNSGSRAGGLVIQFSHVHAANNLISSNHPAGMYILQSAVLISGCTIVWNGPEGIAVGHGTDPLPVSNSIIWGNGTLPALQAQYSCIQGGAVGEGNISNDPLFVDPAEGDFRLTSGSPCINTGNTAAVLDVTVSPKDERVVVSWSAGNDLDGNPRLSGGAVDMGACEFQEGPPSLDFILEYSSDLMTWESVEVGLAWQWLDDKPDGLGRRFYRIGIR